MAVMKCSLLPWNFNCLQTEAEGRSWQNVYPRVDRQNVYRMQDIASPLLLWSILSQKQPKDMWELFSECQEPEVKCLLHPYNSRWLMQSQPQGTPSPLSCSARGSPSPLTAHWWLWQVGTSQKCLPGTGPTRTHSGQGSSPLSGPDPGKTSSRDSLQNACILRGSPGPYLRWP